MIVFLIILLILVLIITSKVQINFKELYFVPIGHLHKQSGKMQWARLDENGELYYVEPTKTYSFDEDKKELLKILKQIEENTNV